MRQQIRELLDALDVNYRWLDHPAVFTVAESQATIEDRNPIKNLLLKDQKGQKFLVIMAGNQRLDLKRLAITLGCKKLSFASSETLLATLGVTPGSVSLFGLLHPNSTDTTLVLDRTLLTAGGEIGFHPNENTATIFFDINQLQKIVDKLGREYLVVDLY